MAVLLITVVGFAEREAAALQHKIADGRAGGRYLLRLSARMRARDRVPLGKRSSPEFWLQYVDPWTLSGAIWTSIAEGSRITDPFLATVPGRGVFWLDRVALQRLDRLSRRRLKNSDGGTAQFRWLYRAVGCAWEHLSWQENPAVLISVDTLGGSSKTGKLKGATIGARPLI